MTTPTPTPADRLALAVCASCGEELCPVPCSTCREASTAVARELAQILRERHDGVVGIWMDDWFDGLGCDVNPITTTEQS